MELRTQRFGTIQVEPQDVIHWQSDNDLATWVLLADSAHPRLYWLQSTTQSSVAIPVCSVQPLATTTYHVASESLQNAGKTQHHAYLVLHELTSIDGTWQSDSSAVVLIDPRSRTAQRASLRDTQTLQHEPSEKVAPLRECA
jgi:hypothetical protein